MRRASGSRASVTRRPSRAVALARVRKLCLALPETSERLSHGAPTFFVRANAPFVMFLDNHHGDGRLALWCAAARGVGEVLVASSPTHYFVPPYVGHLGWVGIRLDRGLAWARITEAIEDAYLARAPNALRGRGSARRP